MEKYFSKRGLKADAPKDICEHCRYYNERDLNISKSPCKPCIKKHYPFKQRSFIYVPIGAAIAFDFKKKRYLGVYNGKDILIKTIQSEDVVSIKNVNNVKILEELL